MRIYIYVSGSSKIQTLSYGSSSIEIEVYSDGQTLKLVFFTYKGAGIYITQQI